MNLYLLFFKIIAFIVLLVFVLIISDVNKKDSKPLTKQLWITLMRLLFPIPPLCYAFFLYQLENTTIWDYGALALMMIGVWIIVLSKNRLGDRHSWTGYSKQNIDNFERTGIYKHIRHPLYTGIYVAVTGSMIVVFQRAQFNSLIFWAYVLANVYVYTFIYISSQRESNSLREQFGEEFAAYERDVPAFVPKLFNKRQ
jgi:protein-S-isoprenylcysteine O-methyltransferase Ste14